MNKRATLKDVAREAGVTAATVSYVVNNTPGQTVRPETRDRVLAAVAKLNYIPNTHAQTLRSSCIPCVGVVIRKNLAVPRFAQMVFGIQERLEQEGHNACCWATPSTGGALPITWGPTWQGACRASSLSERRTWVPTRRASSCCRRSAPRSWCSTAKPRATFTVPSILITGAAPA